MHKTLRWRPIRAVDPLGFPLRRPRLPSGLMRSLSSWLLCACVVCVSGVAFAQTPKSAKPAPDAESKPAKGSSARAKAPDASRIEPAGKSGMSPYAALVLKGEKQFNGGDGSSAIATFEEATRLDEQKMLAFYRLGEALTAAGKLEHADRALQSALGKMGSDEQHAKVLFVIADLRERQGNWQGAKEAWAAYAVFLQNNPKAKGSPAVSAERQKLADRRMKDEADYGKVKDRAAARKTELEREATENAKKDTANR